MLGKAVAAQAVSAAAGPLREGAACRNGARVRRRTPARILPREATAWARRARCLASLSEAA
eukprot:9569231-Alexandrium_andersonii.AAC.1